MIIRRPSKFVVLVLLACAMSSRLFAFQDAPAIQRSSLRIHVLQAKIGGIPDAEIILRGVAWNRTARSDSTGHARFDALEPGKITIQVRRVGFSAGEAEARIEPGDNELDVHIEASLPELDAVRVVADRRRNLNIAEFEERIKRGEANAAVTRKDIEKVAPIVISQMLRRLPGIRVVDSLGIIMAVSTRGKVFQNGGLVDCVLRVMLDGSILPDQTSLDNIIPNDVYGVEVFLGPSRLPSRFAGPKQNAWCGLVAIWTRRGPD